MLSEETLNILFICHPGEVLAVYCATAMVLMVVSEACIAVAALKARIRFFILEK